MQTTLNTTTPSFPPSHAGDRSGSTDCSCSEPNGASPSGVGPETEPAADPWRGGFTRRRVLQGSAALVASLGLQSVTTRYAFGATGPAAETLVVIQMRGGWDTLSIVVPTGDDVYYQVRPKIAVPRSAALPLDRSFGLHPALKRLSSLYQLGQFAPVLACGTPDRSLSHFEAMDTVERGTATGNNTSGWMNRALVATQRSGMFSGVQLGSQVSLSLTGTAPVLAMRSLDDYGMQGYANVQAKAVTAVRSLYQGATDQVSVQANRTLDSIDTAAQVAARQAIGPYPSGNFAAGMADIARLIKAQVGLQIATIDVGGWDMHTALGTLSYGSMLTHLRDLDATIGAFVDDLGPAFANVSVVILSEFGRSVVENGTVGVDHGHGQSMLVLGGGIKGGSVYGTWPGLSAAKLTTNRSLAATTDYRDVLAELLTKRIGIGSLTQVFPDYTPRPLGLAVQV